MMLSSSKSVWSLAVAVTAVLFAVEMEPREGSQSAAYRVDREK